ncbi:hypothetical protein RKD22_001432 [Streptomyces pristinaespiralis]
MTHLGHFDRPGGPVRPPPSEPGSVPSGTRPARPAVPSCTCRARPAQRPAGPVHLVQRPAHLARPVQRRRARPFRPGAWLARPAQRPAGPARLVRHAARPARPGPQTRRAPACRPASDGAFRKRLAGPPSAPAPEPAPAGRPGKRGRCRARRCSPARSCRRLRSRSRRWRRRSPGSAGARAGQRTARAVEGASRSVRGSAPRGPADPVGGARDTTQARQGLAARQRTRPYLTLFVQILTRRTTSPVLGECQIFPFPA